MSGWRDILFWSTEAGTAIFWAALAAAVVGMFRRPLTDLLDRLRGGVRL